MKQIPLQGIPAIIHSSVLAALLGIPIHAEVAAPFPPMPPQWSLLEDFDQDGLTDWDESLLLLNPLDSSDGLSDDDGDALSFAWEWQLGTNSTEADTDGDGWSDSEEVLLYGTDPLDAASAPLGDAPSGEQSAPPDRKS